MKYNKAEKGRGQHVIAQAIVQMDNVAVGMLEQYCMPTGDEERADWFQAGRGSIAFKHPEKIVPGAAVKIAVIGGTFRSTGDRVHRLEIEPVSDPPTHELRKVFLRLTKFLGACEGVTNAIKRAWPGPGEEFWDEIRAQEKNE